MLGQVLISLVIRLQIPRCGKVEDIAGCAQTRLIDDEFSIDASQLLLNDNLDDDGAVLTRRVLDASAIIQCVIGTITEGSAGDAKEITVEFKGEGQSLLGPERAECPTIALSDVSRSASIVRASGVQLIGKSSVVFVRSFRDNGVTRLHWHAQPDKPSIRSAISRLRTSLP